MRRWFSLVLAFAAILSAQKRPFDANAMMALKRISDPQISPDAQLAPTERKAQAADAFQSTEETTALGTERR